MGYSSNINPKELIKWLITTEGAVVTLVAVVDTGVGVGDTMVFVSVSETYDLSTRTGKMTLIGIHTPTKDIISKTYPGLCMNSKYCRIVKQDVAIACASMMPLSPEIVGTEVGDIAPEDAFNPILFKAVSNESMSTLEARLAGLQSSAADLAINGAQAEVENSQVTGLADEFNVYYALLSNRDGFRTANPQQGLVMKGLIPLVFEKYYNFGTNYVKASPDHIPVEFENPENSTLELGTRAVTSMRGRAHPMPRFNTTYLTSITQELGTTSQNNGMDGGHPRNAQAQMPDLMPVYTACIVMPPSRLHQLYYRMVVKTTLEFTEVRPIQEVASFAELNQYYAPVVYHSDYSVQSKIMTDTAGMVDVKDGTVNKIMEGA